MTDAQLARWRQLNHVAAVYIHHAAQLGDNHVQKPVEINCGGKGQREAVDYPLTCFLHFDLAFERERFRSFCHWLQLVGKATEKPRIKRPLPLCVGGS